MKFFAVMCFCLLMVFTVEATEDVEDWRFEEQVTTTTADGDGPPDDWGVYFKQDEYGGWEEEDYYYYGDMATTDATSEDNTNAAKTKLFEQQNDDCRNVEIAFSVINIVICVFGMVGNIIVMYVIVVLKEFKNSTTNLYVLQLAAADFLFLFYLPLKVSTSLEERWPYSLWFCAFGNTVVQMNYYVSITMLVVMSIDRYIAVCHSFSTALGKLRSIEFSCFISAFCWLLSLALCLPVIRNSVIDVKCQCSVVFGQEDEYESCMRKMMEYENKEELCKCLQEENNGIPQFCQREQHRNASERCWDIETMSADDSYDYNFMSDYSVYDDDAGMSNESSGVQFPANLQEALGDDDEAWKTWIYINFFAAYVFPTFVLIVMYGLIIRQIKRSNVDRPRKTSTISIMSQRKSSSAHSEHHRPSDGALSVKRRVTKTCAALVVCFTVCWFPFHLHHICATYYHGDSQLSCGIMYIVQKCGFMFGYLSSAINPYLYTIMGTNFTNRLSLAYVRTRNTFRHVSRSNGNHDYRSGSSSGGHHKSSKDNGYVKGQQNHDHNLSSTKTTRIVRTVGCHDNLAPQYHHHHHHGGIKRVDTCV